MAALLAKDQPKVFRNKLERVAITGASGQLGRHIVKQLLKAEPPFNHGDYTQWWQGYVPGWSFLVITLFAGIDPGTHSKIVKAAAKAGVPHIMPNIYTCDIILNNKELGDEVFIGSSLRPLLAEIDALGVSAGTVLVTGLWYEFSLACPPAFFGFDVTRRSVQLFDDGSRPINTTTWDQCGRAVAAFLWFKLLPTDENDTSPTLQTFRNKPLYISSFHISQREILDSVQRATGTTDAEWDITHESTPKRTQEGKAEFAQGNMLGMAKAYYSRMFYPGQEGVYQHKLHNDVLNLPQDDLDRATAIAVHMANDGWKPM